MLNSLATHASTVAVTVLCFIGGTPSAAAPVHNVYYVLTEIRYAGGEKRCKRIPGLNILKAEKYAEGTDGTDARDLADRAPAWNFRDDDE